MNQKIKMIIYNFFKTICYIIKEQEIKILKIRKNNQMYIKNMIR